MDWKALSRDALIAGVFILLAIGGVLLFKM
jgi:hypothetical protein